MSPFSINSSLSVLLSLLNYLNYIIVLYRYKSTRPRCSWRVWKRPRPCLRSTWQRRRLRRLLAGTIVAAVSRPASRIPSAVRKREVPRTSCQACTSCACAVTERCSCRRRTDSARPTTRVWCAGERPVCTAGTYTVVVVSVWVVRDRQVVNLTHRDRNRWNTRNLIIIKL